MSAVLVPIVCACGWTGKVPTRGLCPGCGADHTHRVTKVRLSKLREIAARAPIVVPIEPQMVRWFVDERHRLIEPISGPNPPRLGKGSHKAIAGRIVEMGTPDVPSFRQRRPMRAYRLSPAGERVLLAAQLAERSGAVCSHGTEVPTSPGAGHWREWHRGHNCEHDPAREAGLRREIVAESAARHAGIEEP